MMSRNYPLEQGTRAIITGASTGIGRSLVIMLAQRFKARLVINARNETLLSEVAEAARNLGAEVEIVAGDISDKSVAEKLAEVCISKYGGIDLLVNNAGLARSGSITDLKPEDWRFVFDINFFGALYSIYAVLPHYLSEKRGKIVNVASIAGKVSFPGSVCYAASKFAMTGMSEGMAAELFPKGIDVITVCPGWVRTEFFTNNKIPDTRNPTVIANQANIKGWIMRNWLSISSEQTAEDIIKACQKGGPHELVLTAPGVIVDRLAGWFPDLVFNLSTHVRADR